MREKEELSQQLESEKKSRMTLQDENSLLREESYQHKRQNMGA